MTVHHEDLLTQVRIRARLHGRNQARRVVRAVLQALSEVVPETAFRRLAAHLPADVGVGSPDPGRGNAAAATSASRRMIHSVAEQLHVDSADAAFYLRVTFEQLNNSGRGVTPARLAPSLPADLRPLLTARVAEPAHPHRQVLAKLGAAVTTLDLRGSGPARPEVDRKVAARRPQTPARPVRHHVG